MIKENYQWVRQCIQTSWTEFHLKCCRTLIELFEDKFRDDKDCKLMTDDLLIDIRNKETEINI